MEEEIEMMAALHSFWQRHRSTALRSLLLAALLHRLNCLAFLAASSPVWLLTAFLLGAVLVHSDAASEDEDRHLYKKIRPHLAAGSSSSSDAESSVTSMDEHLVVVGDVAAWTADDEHRIRSIGSLELERDARLEKLMSRRSSIYRRRNLIDLDVHIPAVHHHCDDTGSAPSSLLRAAHRTNPFDIHQRDPDDGKAAAMLRRHETFAASGSSDGPPARTSRFIRPYFVADDVQEAGAAGDNSSSSSSSPSSSAASDHQTQQQHAVVGVQEAEGAGAAATTSTPHEWGGNGMSLEAVDVELISDSSDDDMSLPGDDAAAAAAALHSNPPDQLDEDEEDSFEVESITQQVAAVKQQPRVTAVEEPVSSPSGHDENASSKELVEENKKMDRELSEIREHHILGPVPVINSSTATSSGVGVGAARAVVTPSLAAAAAAAAPASTPQAPASAPPVAASVPPAAAPAPAPPAAVSAPPAAASRKTSSKSKTASKKPVFGFFRK